MIKRMWYRGDIVSALIVAAGLAAAAALAAAADCLVPNTWSGQIGVHGHIGSDAVSNPRKN